MEGTASGHAARVSAYATVGARLSLFSDRQLADAVAAAPGLGSGIGGRSSEMEVEGRHVFVKRVPLTHIELQSEHLRSTANLFELPLFYQYGAGSTGFGAWRELAAHLMTTGWVLKNEYAGFPLLYHWRVLPDCPPAGFADMFGGVDGAVAHWDGSPAVRRRLEAIGRSVFSLVLFLEYVPQTLACWLGERNDAAQRVTSGASAYRWVEDQLLRGTEFMSGHGLVHFDAHFANLLTDGQQVYFADFGLALSREFELSTEEADFLADHLVYDRCYAPGHLLRHHLPDGVRGGSEHGAFLRDWVKGRRPDGVPSDISAIIDRHAQHSIVLDNFHHRFLTQSKRTPFPAGEARRALGCQGWVSAPGGGQTPT
ncbi:protein kinase family protein [Streptomyces sp. RPA4-2]|uniref:protein kinase family protein n=1 Tax=Streptomyces sp. RPA4-2 TaxID=2721244 RepID=UPI00143EE4A4|nr:protein kinase family protein [Streptomyces sp. RPA4-2]QIY67909.1 protein kinase family protein [Streptomyces sp. RPA4-2]